MEDIKFNRKIIFNKRTGQASIVLPKKMFDKMFKKIPKEAEIKVKW